MKKVTKKTVSKNASQKAGSGRGILSRFDFVMDTDNRFLPKDFEAVKEYFKGKCVYCGTKERDGVKLVREHAIPINQQLGMSRLGNIVPACEQCNSIKGGIHFIRFCRQDAKRGREAEKDIKKYMKSVGYKGLGKNKAERDKIRKIISNALEQMAKIRDEAVTRIEKIVNKKPTKKITKKKTSTKKIE